VNVVREVNFELLELAALLMRELVWAKIDGHLSDCASELEQYLLLGVF
jgi:hypothetical protein